MTSDEQGSPANTMEERMPRSKVTAWLLTKVNRAALAAGIAAFVFGVIVLVDLTGPADLARAVANSDPIETGFQALVGAIITGVTLVVTLSQLVLSQELGALGDQWSRMSEAMDFRESAEDDLDLSVASPDPATFLQQLVRTTADRAREVADQVRATRDGRAYDQLCAFLDDVVDNAQHVVEELEGAEFGTFAVVTASLDYNYSWKIHRVRKTLADERIDLDDDVRESLESLLTSLTFLGPAREHFKTLYFEFELSELSRKMMYLAVPALAVAVSGVFYLESASLPGTTLGVPDLTWITAAAVSIAVSPFVLLLSYILRIVTVAKLTLAMGPFVLRESARR